MTSTHEPPETGQSIPLSRDPHTITDLGDFVGSMMSEARGWANEERAYLTLLLTKRAAALSQALVGALAWTILVAAVLLFASIAGAIAIGRALEDPALGYLVMAGIYAVMLVVFALFWKGSLGDRFKLKIINLLHGH